MSAASNVYLFGGTATFPIQIEGEIKMDSYPALFLPEYGEKIKELFYLDAVLVIDDEQGNKAFLGMVKDIPGSLNYQIHNTTRWFKQRLVPADTNQPYIVMNDAGLNTLPHVLLLEVPGKRANTPKLNAVFKSSYFADSIKRGYESKLVSATNWNAYDITPWSIPAKQQITVTDTISTGYIKDDVVVFRAYIENEEGRYYSNEITTVMLPGVFSYGTEFRTSACITSNLNTIVYMYETDFDNLDQTVTTIPSVTGIYMWKDEDFTIHADDGFYGRLSGSKIFEVRGGQILSYQICTNPPVTKDISIYLNERYVNNDTYFDIQIVKNKILNYDIKVTGSIMAYDIHGNTLSSPGLGNYNITILATEDTKTYSTNKPNNTGTTGIDYYLPTVSTRVPSTLTYIAYKS